MAKVTSVSSKLPQWAQPHDGAPADLWPDISKLPTRSTVALLAAARYSRPDDYLAVVTDSDERRLGT